jgi:hypothetical protein
MIRHCGDCALFLTDTDENGNVTEFHYSTSDSGFCPLVGLFYTVYQSDVACDMFTPEHKEKPSSEDA